MYTVELSTNGHTGGRDLVTYREVVLIPWLNYKPLPSILGSARRILCAHLILTSANVLKTNESQDMRNK